LRGIEEKCSYSQLCYRYFGFGFFFGGLNSIMQSVRLSCAAKLRKFIDHWWLL